MANEEIEDLPGFSQPPQQPTKDPLDPAVTQLTQPESPNQDQGRPSVSGSHETPDPSQRPPARPTNSTSSTTFSDVEDALAGYGASIFMLATMGINRASARRTGQPTTRWLATDDEAGRFGEALGRISARRVPEELVDNGDTADYLIMGEAVLTYGIRASLGLSAEEAMAAAAAYAQQPSPPPPGPGAQQDFTPPPTAPEPRAHVVTDPGAEAVDNRFGAVPATPPPPTVIQPGI